jgi:hypothetical protein
MRYAYKVFDMTEPKPEGEGRPFKMMYNMSLKRLQKTLDPKRSYQVEYKNKKNNFIKTIIKGKENK